MKTIFLISFIVLTWTTLIKSETQAELEAMSHACLPETKVTEKEVDDFYSSDAKFNAGPPNLQCHLKCVMEKLGELKGGVVNVEKLMKDWKDIPELAEFRVTDPKVFEKCKSEKGANDCETAFKIAKCLRQSKKT